MPRATNHFSESDGATMQLGGLSLQGVRFKPTAVPKNAASSQLPGGGNNSAGVNKTWSGAGMLVVSPACKPQDLHAQTDSLKQFGTFPPRFYTAPRAGTEPACSAPSSSAAGNVGTTYAINRFSVLASRNAAMMSTSGTAATHLQLGATTNSILTGSHHPCPDCVHNHSPAPCKPVHPLLEHTGSTADRRPLSPNNVLDHDSSIASVSNADISDRHSRTSSSRVSSAGASHATPSAHAVANSHTLDSHMAHPSSESRDSRGSRSSQGSRSRSRRLGKALQTQPGGAPAAQEAQPNPLLRINLPPSSEVSAPGAATTLPIAVGTGSRAAAVLRTEQHNASVNSPQPQSPMHPGTQRHASPRHASPRHASPRQLPPLSRTQSQAAMNGTRSPGVVYGSSPGRERRPGSWAEGQSQSGPLLSPKAQQPQRTQSQTQLQAHLVIDPREEARKAQERLAAYRAAKVCATICCYLPSAVTCHLLLLAWRAARAHTRAYRLHAAAGRGFVGDSNACQHAPQTCPAAAHLCVFILALL